MKLTIGETSYDVEVTADGLTVDGQAFAIKVEGFGNTRMVTVNGRAIRVDIAAPGEPTTDVTVEGQTLEVSLTGSARTAQRTAAAARASVRQPGAAASGAPAAAGAIKGAVTAQMTGRVVRVAVAAGTTVAAGDLLLILEAMKMENEIRSPRGGTVKQVLVAPGDRVNQGGALVVIED